MTSEYAFSLNEIDALDTASFVPLYVQLAEKISAVIESRGDEVTGKILPSEFKCTEHFKISRPTVRQAMLDLTRRGLVIRKKGRGTFAAPPKINHDMSHGFEDEMRAAHRNVRFRALEWRRIDAPEHVLRALQKESGAEVWYLRRLRVVDDSPLGIEERFFPLELGNRLSGSDAKFQPMVRLLRKVTGAQVARLNIEVSSSLADREVAGLLKTKAGMPLLVKKLTYLFNGEALAFGTTTFLGEQYQFKFMIDLPI